MTDSSPRLEDWIGRRASKQDVIAPGPLAQFNAVLDYDGAATGANASGPKSEVPPGGLWIYFHEHTRQSELGPDGHTARGGFMPPVQLPRRMFAGARETFLRPVHVGDEVTRNSEILSVVPKPGRSGKLVFVTVRHEYVANGLPAVVEEQEIVYREEAKKGVPAAAPPEAPSGARWSRTITPDPVLLFRYSAITFNAHRIHYDRTYCREVENYPGIIVHGTLTATYLMDLCRREQPGRRLATFNYRAVSPLFDTAPFSVHAKENDGGGWDMWAATAEGGLAMTAEATFSD
ncbi:MAG: MaoC family dehydratase N-terminal domain-containing protein [Proteobacteria bacterium]|nr:MaoC family dehydratase N-terminal domain-containing protein [Pseudomonadota bacterium]